MLRKLKTMDGNTAAAHVAYAYSELSAIYPITPSSTMAEYVDEWASENRNNIFGRPLQVSELQSEAGAAAALHGALVSGALATTFTASQGLLLMIPNIYKTAGELLPGVFHVAARTIATHALSIFGDHSDIYACRQTGAAMLSTGSVQQVMDLAPVAHLSALKGRVPFIHFFDGFRTSHEMQKIQVWDYEDLKEMFPHEEFINFKKNALNPNHAKMMGSAQNPDIFFQAREAGNPYYQALPAIVEDYMNLINQKLGTDYGLFRYYGAKDATHVIIAMGSVCDTIRETIDYLNAAGQKTGLIQVHLYRPFSAKHLINALPESVTQITVLDRTKEPGAMGEPLFLDVTAALKDSVFSNVPIMSGRYGLSSKNTTPDQILAVYKNDADTGKKFFTIGIEDDVTHLSLPISEHIITESPDTIRCKFWGLGGDGTISANKNSIKIIGNHTDKYVQAYFDYDSKKSRGLTVSHLRFGNSPIRSSYLVENADFVACHNPTYLHKYDIVQELVDGGSLLLNCRFKEEELEEYIPGQVKQYIATHNIRLYIIDALTIGKEIGLNNKTSTILQAAFFRLAGIIPIENARRLMKEAAKVSYHKKGDKVVRMNYDAIDRGIDDVIEVKIPDHWKKAEYQSLDNKLLSDRKEVLDYVVTLQKPITDQKGNHLPVSAFVPYADGSFPSGSCAHERRGVATEVPFWKPENCIQCNRCSYVCPHAVIRPAVMNEEETSNAPKNMVSLPMNGMPGFNFSITISNVDCTGCGSCVGVCPGKQNQKALEMCPVKEHDARQEYFDYGKSLPIKQEVIDHFKESTVKGSQFKRPLMEFSGACAGCGETPYAKLVTQLYGERMYIANATGCSSIWANSSPSTAYTATPDGKGPAWANSLFEDAAEFGYGMLLAEKAIREHLRQTIGELSLALTNMKNNESHISFTSFDTLSAAITEWLDTYSKSKENTDATIVLTKQLESFIEELKEDTSKDHIALSLNIYEMCDTLLNQKDYLNKKSHWIFGGDGWAYDIGYGGLDHVLASGENINILVFDTEVYSNTGGQASKATPTGSTAKFASGGKLTPKKNLAAMAMNYVHVYVAQVAMGADYNQTIKAITEAESYPGPSLILCYAPCISHGIRSGMGSSPHEEKRAVDSGYYHLFRYNPGLRAQGKNPFILDSKEPTLEYREFLSGENRYEVLKMMDNSKADDLLEKASIQAKEKYNYLKKLEKLYEPDSTDMEQ